MADPKITLVTLEYPPQTGGIATYLRCLVEASRGEVEVVSAKPLFQKKWPQWRPLVAHIRNLRTIVFVSHVLPVGTAAWIAKFFGGPEYLVLFHGTDLRRIQTPWKRWLVRRICAQAKTLFCNSEATLRELRRVVPNAHATVITPGVEAREILSRDDARERLHIAQDAKLVVSISRLVPRKGIDMALRAMAQVQIGIRKEVQEALVKYVVLGDGPDQSRLENIAKEAGTSVQWIHGADDETKWLWLAAADLFLLPVRDEGDDVEGFGIVFLEAALAGVPSIAGKSGGAVEAVVDNETGVLVEPRDVTQIENAITKLLTDESLRVRLGTAARERVLRDFTWEARWRIVDNAAARTSSTRRVLPRLISFAVTPVGGRDKILAVSPAVLRKPSRVVLLKQARTVEHLQRESAAAEAASPRGLGRGGVSIVIPCYNHARELRVTLETLAKQTLLPREVVVVDDFSDDNPEAVVRAFNAQCEKNNLQLSVGFLRLRHRHGAPYARNEGSRLVSGEYVMFLDADAELVPDALETFVRALEDHPECNFSYSNFRWGMKLFRGQPFSTNALKQRNFITTSSLIRRSAFPGFDESLKKFQDWDLWLTMAEKGSKGVWIDQTLFRITPHRQGISTWFPRFMYWIPWDMIGYLPKPIVEYREAEKIIRQKHHV